MNKQDAFEYLKKMMEKDGLFVPSGNELRNLIRNTRSDVSAYTDAVDALAQQIEHEARREAMKNGIMRVDWNNDTTMGSDFTTYATGGLVEIDAKRQRREMARIFREEMSATVLDREENMSQPIIEIKTEYDYSGDVGFVPLLDTSSLSTYDIYAVGKNLNNFKNTGNDTKSFKDLVFKSWGKVVEGVNAHEPRGGGYCFQGNKWVNGRAGVEFAQYADYAGSGCAATVISKADVNFTGPSDADMILLSCSYSSKTIAVVLFNINLVSTPMSGAGKALYFGTDRVKVRMTDVKIPYPLNQFGDYNDTFSHHTTATVVAELHVVKPYAFAVIGEGDFGNKGSRLIFPEDSVLQELLAMNLQAATHTNVFTQLAAVLQEAKDEGVIKTGSFAQPIIPARNEFVVEALNGNDPKADLAKRVENTDIKNVRVPYGLTELPLPPGGYRWIGDVSGLLYLVDAKGKQAYLPFEVYDVGALIENLHSVLASLRKKKKQPNGECTEMARQIKLIQELFLHQACLMHGTAGTYEMLAPQFTGIENEEAQDEDIDPF
jgi:hypothetical protein